MTARLQLSRLSITAAAIARQTVPFARGERSDLPEAPTAMTLPRASQALPEPAPEEMHSSGRTKPSEYAVGDVVWIEEHRPISKLKRWTVVRGEKKQKVT